MTSRMLSPFAHANPAGPGCQGVGQAPCPAGRPRMTENPTPCGPRSRPARDRNRKRACYFFRRAPDRLAALKEIPVRIAFCWTAAAVRPSFLAT